MTSDTAHPTAEWVSQQLREAFPWDSAPRFLHRDNDGIYGKLVIDTMGLDDVPSAPRSPWQNPYCERVVGTLRRELLNHVIILGEGHARGLLQEYSSPSGCWASSTTRAVASWLSSASPRRLPVS